MCSARPACRGWATLLVCLVWSASLPAEDIPFAEGRLFRITREGTAPAHFFGTMHAEDPEVVNLPEPVARAFSGADRLVMEVVPDTDTIVRAMLAMAYTDGRTLRQAIGPELYAETLRAVARIGMSEAAVRDLKPWAVATMLSAPPAATGEFLDMRLYRQAVAVGKPVQGLETIEEQLDVFDDLPASLQKALLVDALRERDSLAVVYAELRQTYLRGDLAGLKRLSAEHLEGGDPELQQYFQQVITDGRNRLMVTRLAPILAHGNAFVAVGALHLPGEGGVLNLLQKQGWTVERVF